jgi:hypothetical protein
MATIRPQRTTATLTRWPQLDVLAVLAVSVHSHVLTARLRAGVQETPRRTTRRRKLTRRNGDTLTRSKRNLPPEAGVERYGPANARNNAHRRRVAVRFRDFDASGGHCQLIDALSQEADLAIATLLKAGAAERTGPEVGADSP